MSGRRNSYVIATEKELAPIYSKVNGVPSATNGQCVLMNKTQNVVFADTGQVKHLSPVSVTSLVIDVHNDTTDARDATRARTARRKSIVSLSEINLRPSKVVFIIGLCCVIGLSLPSVIFYYVPVGTQSHDDTYSSLSFSMVMNNCNVSAPPDSNLSDTYEALRKASQSTYPFCITKLSEALTQPETCKQLNNSSYIEDIMCQKVRQSYCTAEWRLSELNNSTSEGLINCDKETASINCDKQFVLANDDSMCRPLCTKFSQYDETFTNVYVALTIISHITNMIGGVAVFIASYIKRRKMFCFPQVLIVINVVIMTIVALFLFITAISVDSRKLLCSSEYLQFNSSTVFCQIQGFTWTSAIVLYGLFWFLYIFHLALKLLYPLKSAKLDDSDNSKTIHIIEVFVVFVIGTTPFIVFAGTSKYQAVRLPPIFCGYDTTYMFYATVLPTITVGSGGLILMLLVLYKLHIHQGIFKRRSVGKQIRSCHFTTPEVKVFFGFCYLLAVLVSLWAVFCARHVTFDNFITNIELYVRCMSTGTNNPNCERFRRQFEEDSYPSLEAIYIVLVGFVNFSNLPFIVQFKTVKHSVRRATRRLSSKSQTSEAKIQQ